MSGSRGGSISPTTGSRNFPEASTRAARQLTVTYREAGHVGIGDPQSRHGDSCDRSPPLERDHGWRRAAGRWQNCRDRHLPGTQPQAPERRGCRQRQGGDVTSDRKPRARLFDKLPGRVLNDGVADPETAMSTRPPPANVTICACEEGHVAAVTTIYAHHVLHGLASFEIVPPSSRRRCGGGASISSAGIIPTLSPSVPERSSVTPTPRPTTRGRLHAGARKDDTCARRPPSIGSCGAPRAEDA